MKSPKSRQHKEKKVSYRRREHKNKAFYNSKAWRDTREAYLRDYQLLVHSHVSKHTWAGMSLKPHQVSYILSLDFLVCEKCLRFYAAEAYDKVEPGKELDHIKPVNPKCALDRIITGATVISTNKDGTMNGDLNYLFGDPFSFDNLQYLCKRHHAKKSQRER